MTNRAMRMYCLLSGVGIIIGETAFVVNNDKFPPLWIDDYVIAASMLAAVRLWDHPLRPAWVLANYAFLTGNIYAMLFARFEPVNPPDRPWKVLAAVLVWGAVSTALAAVHAARRASVGSRPVAPSAGGSGPEHT